MNFGQVITAMVTPFDENLSICPTRTKQLVEFLDNNGTDTFLIAGTTGEGPTLSLEEKIYLVNLVRQFTNKKIMLNIGTNNTSETIKSIQEVSEKCSVDGFLVVCPYYNKPCQDGLQLHFELIAQSTKLPIMIYNIPGRTSVTMHPTTVAKLAKIKNITSIKESTGDIHSITEIVRLTKDDDFVLYSGDDHMTLPTLAVGGVGVVSVASHIVGKDIQNMISSYKFNRNSDAAIIHQQLHPFFNGIFYKTNPIAIKEILNHLNISVGTVRPPLYYNTSEEDRSFIIKLLDEQHFFSK